MDDDPQGYNDDAVREPLPNPKLAFKPGAIVRHKTTGEEHRILNAVEYSQQFTTHGGSRTRWHSFAQYDVVKGAIQQAFIDSGGTVSHHHGVGLEHAPWLEQDISTAGVDVMKGLFESADPGNNFNPGKIIASAPAPAVTLQD